MTSDIAWSGADCTPGVTPRQLVQSSSENDKLAGSVLATQIGRRGSRSGSAAVDLDQVGQPGQLGVGHGRRVHARCAAGAKKSRLGVRGGKGGCGAVGREEPAHTVQPLCGLFVKSVVRFLQRGAAATVGLVVARAVAAARCAPGASRSRHGRRPAPGGRSLPCPARFCSPGR